MNISRKQVINFEIINNQCRGNPLTKRIVEHKTVDRESLKNYPEKGKKRPFSQFFEISNEMTFGSNGIC